MPDASPKPILAIVSDVIRRDLEEPLRYFKRLRVVHFYHSASYGDMLPTDYRSDTVQYQGTRDLMAQLAQLSPAIIQGPEPYASRRSFKIALALRFLTQRKKIPYFFPVLENKKPREKFGPLVGWLIERILAWYGRGARRIIYLNEGARRNLLAVGVPRTKLVRLLWGTWGINTVEFRPEPRRRSAKPIILFVGRIEMMKGVPYLVEAFQKLKTKLPQLELWLAGSGSLAAMLSEIPGVKYLRVVKNKDLPALFARAWVTCAPSITMPQWEEQVGMVNLQSLACGTPVVTTDSGAIPEYVEDGRGALVVAERSSEALATALERLLTDRNLHARFSRLGRVFIEERYDIRKSIAAAEKFVLNLLR